MPYFDASKYLTEERIDCEFIRQLTNTKLD